MTVGIAIRPTLTAHGVSLANVSMPISSRPVMTRPPGQPACRMFSHFVFSLLNIVATTGLMNASTVPFASAQIKLPQYRS